MPAPNFAKTAVGDLCKGDYSNAAFFGGFLYYVFVGWAMLSFYVPWKSLQESI